MKKTYLIFGIFIYASEILCNSILWSKMLLSEINCLFVWQYGCWIGPQKFLFNAHVMVCNGQYCNFIFIAVLALSWEIIKIIIGSWTWIKLFPKHHFLEQNDGTHCMIEGQLMLVQLWKDGTNVEMCISLCLWPLKSTFNSQSSL